MTFSCREMVWVVDWIHLVGVGVGIKKTRGVTKCIQSTTHTISRHENVIQSSLPPPHPISEPLSLTPLNRSNINRSAFFHSYYLSDSEGSRTKAQRLGGVEGERIE